MGGPECPSGYKRILANSNGRDAAEECGNEDMICCALTVEENPGLAEEKAEPFTEPQMPQMPQMGVSVSIHSNGTSLSKRSGVDLQRRSRPAEAGIFQRRSGTSCLGAADLTTA